VEATGRNGVRAGRLLMRRTRRRGPLLARSLAAALALVATLAVSGCGEKQERAGELRPEPFELVLDYFPNADHAPIYAAQAGGHFRDVGLDVRIRAPSDPSAPIALAAAGRADLALSYEPQVFRARARGGQVVSVGALVQRPLTSIISLPKAAVRRPADLRGKRVGTAGIDYQAAFLRTILRQAGVDPRSVQVQDVGFNLSPALLTRRVDAVLGAFWNYEGVELRQQKRDPQIIRVDDAGVPTYDELVFVTGSEQLADADARGRIRRFMAAVSRGTRDLERDPQAGLRGLLEANPDLDPRLQRAVVDVTLPLLEAPRGKPFGWQEPRDWRAFEAWMRRERLLRGEPAPGSAFTNELLPGEGL
jgi:putative hydroxymethylpyrimidine transport system substrate-binding protein